jgi:UDPglucose 6-dehydrogenase
MNLVVIGAGYVGLSNALGFAGLGHRVACVDADAGKIAMLDVGDVPFREPGMKERLRQMQDAGRVMFTADLDAVIADAEAFIICDEGDDELAALHHELPPFVPILELPEPFVAHPERIVVGIDDAAARPVAERMYRGVEAPILFMSSVSAELVREAGAAFLAAKASFVADLAACCEEVGADMRDVADALSTELVIGPDLVRPGANFFATLERELDGLKGRRIAVWGLRDLESVRQLYARGADIVAYDAFVDEAVRALPDAIAFAPTAVDACEGAEALIILSDGADFRDVSLTSVRERMIEPRVFDGRNLLADRDLESLGFSYYGVGLGAR